MRKPWILGGLAFGALVAAASLLADAPTSQGNAVEQPVVALPPAPSDAVSEAPAAAPAPRPLDLRDPSRPGRQAPAPTQAATAEGPLRRDPMTGLMFRPFADLQLPS